MSDNDILEGLRQHIERVPDVIEFLHTPLIAYISTVRRNVVRKREERVAAAWDPVDSLSGRREAADDFAEWAAELADSYMTVGGKKLRVGDMTLDDWRQRIADLNAKIASTAESIARVEQIVVRLQRAHKETLDAYLQGAQA